MNTETEFDLEKWNGHSSELPACQGAEVLALLKEINPIADLEEQRYRDRVEKFANNVIIRKLMGNITASFIAATVERMFNSNEVTPGSDPFSPEATIVNLDKLVLLKSKVIALFSDE